jgi:uncharacterized protein (TIGR02646 family)
MIKVKRLTPPLILTKKASKWTKTLLNAKAPEDKKKAAIKYKHKEIKEALNIMFHGKCAYCESKINHVDYGQIEHYKPKALFPDSMFDWHNLLLSCTKCNSTGYKGSRFPDENDGGPILNPCEDEPTDHLDFIFDRQAKITTVVGKTKRGIITEEILGLNRTDLRIYRSIQIEKIMVLFSMASSNKEAKFLLDDATRDDAEYAAFARALIKNHPPPSPA